MPAATAVLPAALPAERAAVLYRQVSAVLVSAGLDRGAADRALQALDDGAVVPSAIPGAYHVASSDGEAAYLTGTAFCNCPATAYCYHRVAVIIVVAAGHQP